MSNAKLHTILADLSRYPFPSVETKDKRRKIERKDPLVQQMFQTRYRPNPPITDYTQEGVVEYLDKTEQEINNALGIDINNEHELNKAYNAAAELAIDNKDNHDPTKMWSTIGDLHGSTLKLFYFMILQGIATADEATYDRFVDHYELSFDATKYNKAFVTTFKTDIMPQIKIKEGACIRLGGDEIGDRAGNDFFTLTMIVALIKSGANIEIMASNHAVAFIKSMEAIIRDPSIRFSSTLGVGQFASAERLQLLMDSGAVTLDEVKSLYETYKTKIKAFSYDYNDEGKLNIYSHAPVSELDILDIAQHLLIRHVKESSIMSEETFGKLHTLVGTIIQHRNMLQPNEIIQLIDIINAIVTEHAGKNTLTEILSVADRLKSERPTIGEDAFKQRSNGNGVDPLVYGLHFATSNRDDPLTVASSRRNQFQYGRPKNKDVINTHGHADVNYQFCHCLDNYSGKHKESTIDLLPFQVSHAVKPELKAEISNSNNRNNM